MYLLFFFFFQAEDGIRDFHVTGVQTCALPISAPAAKLAAPIAALSYDQADPRLSGWSRIYRRRDSGLDQEHAGRRPRLSSSESHLPRQILRAAAVAAAVQADSHGRRPRPIFPSRQVFPR